MIRLTKEQLAKLPEQSRPDITPRRGQPREQIKALKELYRQTPQARREAQRRRLEKHAKTRK